jgi:fumarate reductase subunit C
MPIKSPINKTPARLDFLQSATGLLLALFMWLHMFFVSSILLGKDVMYNVTKFFEGYFFFGESYPIIVTLSAGFIFVVFIVHAAIAMRKFPSGYKEYKVMKNHVKQFNHTDTTLWFWQIFTGFAMFFLGSVHLYIIMTHPDQIGPYASSDRVVSEWMWPLYILLLLAVEFHGSIGLYRLALKWGWFEGANAKKSRIKLRRYKYAITVFFLLLGFLTLAAYIKIGIEHKDRAGERYQPVAQVFYQGAVS